ncbi:MAG: DEAD/DEAH box helicase [Flavobacteriales bacterium]
MTNTTSSTTNNNPTNRQTIPSVSIKTACTGASSQANELGMRTMQARAYARRGEQYLLIKSPPASGKSRALMFIALDKLHNQDLKQAIIVVPERSIGSSFADEPLTQHGFYWDWTVAPQWNLCNAPSIDEPRVAKSKVDAVRKFLASTDRALVCTHATFRFALEELGVAAFDQRLIAIDEFHHVSSNPDNKLGSQLAELMQRDQVHVVAMTGSYFRGDSEAVLSQADEAKFETVSYTYYEQLNGYRWLKSLDIGYFFYTGAYVNAIGKVLDPTLKTIIHIPNVNARESLKDKQREVDDIMHGLGEWQGIDAATGFHLIKAATGRVLKVADLVDDSDAAKRSKVLTALKDPSQKNNREHVDMIIALGMAKEGFDWIWCEHALTVGYRSSLTEIVQIIGRATRDAEGKTSSRFTNLIAEPSAEQSAVAEAVNDMLKAISASLLMEQVLAPRYTFTPKDQGHKDGFDYGVDGYQVGGKNIGVNTETGQIHIEIGGLVEPKSKEATRICQEDLNEVITSFLQDKTVVERGLFDTENTLPEELTQLHMGKIVRERYPELDASDQEAVRQHAVAAMNTTQEAKRMLAEADAKLAEQAAASENQGSPADATAGVIQGGSPAAGGTATDNPFKANTALLDGVRKFINVRDLDIDLIDRINPFDAAYAVMARALDEKTLRQVQASIAAKNITIAEDEARDLAKRALLFKQEKGRLPDLNAADPWEQKIAQGMAAFARYRTQAKAAQIKEAAKHG